MLKILFPTDFSDTANNAFVYALQMCKRLDGELYILHTHGMPVISGGIPTQLMEEAQSGSTLGSFEYFKEQVPALRKLAEEHHLDNVNMNFILEDGLLLQTIQTIIEREEIKFLVMGTTGNSGFENKIFGSNTMAVINNVGIPVLSVPHLAKFGKIEYVGFTNVFDAQDEKAMEQIVDIAQRYKAEIKSLYIDNGNKKVTDAEIKRWKEKFAVYPVSFYSKKSNDVVKAVFEFIDDEFIDIICCVQKNRPFFERLFQSSLTQQLSYHAKTPLLVFHEK